MVRPIDYPKPASLYTETSQGGALLEGRFTRFGKGSMKIAFPTQDWEAYGFRDYTIQVPEVPVPVIKKTWYIRVKSALTWSTLGDIKRWDTISDWKCTAQEVLRHLGLASVYTNSEYWKEMEGIVTIYADQIKAAILEWLDFILAQGDMGFEQFHFYVKEHKDSADPFGIGKWSDILDTPQEKLAWNKTNAFIRDFRNYFDKEIKLGKQALVKGNCTYPGMRARPGDAKILTKSDYEAIVFIEKWRDRKVGGIPGLSQITYPIYKNAQHKLADAIWDKLFKKILNVTIRSLSLEGPVIYQDLMNDSKVFLYDLKTAEKQVGLLFKWLGFAYDSGHPMFQAMYAAEMYSGIGPTSPLNELFQVVFLRVMLEKGYKITKWYKFSDNMGVDVELPDNVHAEKAEAFCGLLVHDKRFGPISMCTDNPKHRLPLKGNKQVQHQRVQYIVRPLLGVIMNNLDRMDSCSRFIKWVSEARELATDPEMYEGARQDVIKDAILWEGAETAEEKISRKELHKKLIDNFAHETQWVRDNFIVQDTDADMVTDLRWE